MDGVLWLPFPEPAFLLHGDKVRGAPLPNLAAESRDEYLKLAKVWDAKSLLRLHPGPLCDGHFSRVFSAFKNDAADRQIGDRRIPNSRERHFDGPSRCLPPGSLPCGLSRPRTAPSGLLLIEGILPSSHGFSGKIFDQYAAFPIPS